MKIAMISTAHCGCGIAEYTEMLGTAIRDLGHEVTVFSEINPQENLPYKLPFVDCWERWIPITYLKRMVPALNDYNPDVIHWQYEWGLHGPYGAQWDGPLYELARPKKHFMTWHNIIPDGKSAFYGRMVDKHLTHTAPMRNRLAQMTFPAQIIPHGTRENWTQLKPEEAKERLGIPTDRKVIATFGFLMARKGSHLILNTFKQLKRYCPEAFFLLIGGRHPKGQLAWAYNRLFERAQELYPNDIKLTGFLQDGFQIDTILSAADMFAFPHLGDESLLSASGSIRRVIDHGKLVITQDIPFYADFPESMVVKIPKTESLQTVGRWYGRILSDLDNPIYEAKRQALKQYAKETYWPKVAQRTVDWYGS